LFFTGEPASSGTDTPPHLERKPMGTKEKGRHLPEPTPKNSFASFQTVSLDSALN
jgi:hypothetical protein